ncbi:MAG: type II secretion system major pseudopilin GspG [Bryobacteraceae bacterium]|jgi:general secretion pathway protein G
MKQTANRRKRGEGGVTLIEMLVVVTIIGLFVALVGPRLWSNVDKAKITAARAQIQDFMGALGTYKLDNGNFPTTEQGLAALRVKPADAAEWNGPYIPQEIPKDPWGHDYIYKFPGDHGDEPDIISYGADGQPGGDGINADVVSWKSQ